MIERLRGRFLLAMGVTAMCAVVVAPGCKGSTRRALHCGGSARPIPPSFPSCPSGNFCTSVGAIAAAEREAGAPRDASIGPPVAPEMAPHPYADCPAHASDPAGTTPVYAETSFDFATTGPERASQPTACCYTWVQPCPGGRPVLGDDGVAIVAPTREVDGDDGWGSHDAASRDEHEPRASLAAHWAREAAFEHASIAAFARAALQLMALGAPAELVAGAHAAALDEVDHARRCYAIASRYAGRTLGPGPMPASALSFDVDAASVARETLLGGCVNETIAALAAHDACADAEVARDRELREFHATIAADEARHAELGWATLAWLVRAHPSCVPALEASLGDLARELDAAAPTVSARSLRLRVVRDLVVPCARALLGVTSAKVGRTSRSSRRSRRPTPATAGFRCSRDR